MKEHLVEASSIKFLADDVVELAVSLVKPRAIKFQAGQFVFFNIGGPFKAYSITSPPGDGRSLRFLVKLEPGGAGSGFVKNLKLGQRFQLTGPEGNFVVRSRVKNICCVAAGIGIAPFTSIVPDIIGKKYSGRLALIYGTKDQKHLFYADDFAGLAARHKNFKFIPLAGQRAAGYLERHFTEFNNSLFYICGSIAAVAGITEILSQKGADESQIVTETFLH